MVDTVNKFYPDFDFIDSGYEKVRKTSKNF